MAATSPYLESEAMTMVEGHHASIKALWETKWQKPCSMGIYPFPDGKLEDFEKVFAELIQMDLKEPYDPDVYAQPFFPVAEGLVAEAAAAEKDGKTDVASGLYLRAAALYRIARFPVMRSPLSIQAWERGKAAYIAGSKYLSPPNYEVVIPYTHGIASDLGSSISAFLRVPPTASSSNPAPVILFICGLDAYKTDLTSRTAEHVSRGFACLSVDIPGTGDSPAAKNDPLSPDRQWSSVLDWIATQPELDAKRVSVRSVSTGGYYAMRIAHTHGERLRGVVSQGGGCHRMFDPAWIAAQGRMEYPFDLAEALAHKFGYDSVDAYAADAQQRFSLLTHGIFEKPSCRLLLINGLKDGIFPIEDSMIPLEYGRVKDARFLQNRYHMGNPGAEEILYDWLDQFRD